VVGVLDAAVLSIHAIGRGYAHATNHSEKHGVKQTDRMLGNAGSTYGRCSGRAQALRFLVMTAFEAVLDQALKLPDEEWSKLAASFLNSLEPEDGEELSRGGMGGMVRRARQATPRDLDRRRPPLNPSPAVLRVPILRAEGKVFAEGYPTLVPPSLFMRRLVARESQRQCSSCRGKLWLEPSLYFYVGFSHPSFGDVVLVYEPESFDLDPGGASPFDTVASTSTISSSPG